MKHYTTTMTQRGQVTVPVEVQRLLGMGPRDKVTFTVEGREVRLASARDQLHAVFGLGKRLNPDDRTSLDTLIEGAKDDHAEQIAAKRQAG